MEDKTGEYMYMNVDAVKVSYEICNDCPTGVDAPVLSATTITNDCMILLILKPWILPALLRATNLPTQP